MKLQYTTKNNRLTVELEADTQTDLWEELASFQEIFEESSCGKCKKENLRCVVRVDKEENKYYELHCLDCHARLSYGCHKKGGGLFPKRKADDGKIKGAYGWTKFNREKGIEE